METPVTPESRDPQDRWDLSASQDSPERRDVTLSTPSADPAHEDNTAPLDRSALRETPERTPHQAKPVRRDHPEAMDPRGLQALQVREASRELQDDQDATLSTAHAQLAPLREDALEVLDLAALAADLAAMGLVHTSTALKKYL